MPKRNSMKVDLTAEVSRELVRLLYLWIDEIEFDQYTRSGEEEDRVYEAEHEKPDKEGYDDIIPF